MEQGICNGVIITGPGTGVDHFTIYQAFEVIFKDMDINILILGIDEMITLHQTDPSSETYLVRSIVRVIGELSCSSSEKSFVPIMSGTRQGLLHIFHYVYHSGTY
ncbi:1040_t:CDS:2 [Funneliformis geosporum]|nr:1040_t:CDS:2 [Funneliformis geosporum]